MAKGVLDDAMIGIPCPECGQKTEKSIGWLKTNKEFACLGCGRAIKIDADAAIREIKEVDKAVNDLLAKIRNFRKRH